jgi:hypothetical protein
MIYFYVKRAKGPIWDEITFPKGKEDAARRFWINALMKGYLIEQVGPRK